MLTTSYPRSPDDPSGRFVADAVQHLRERGATIDVVGPERFRHYGVAYGGGVVANLRRRPWLALAVPALLVSFARAARRAAVDADLVHAHWLPAGAVAIATRRRFVVTLHGSDVALARRVPWIAGWILRRARITICVSEALAEEARRFGAREVRVVPNGVEIPEDVAEPADPPEVLYVGRLAPEKGVVELVEAARDLNLVVVGDGPLRARVPQAQGFVSGPELERFYARASVVACPSRREGFGLAAAEALAHGRPVVASGVGGLLDLVVDGVTGLVVPPRDPAALRQALERLLADEELRVRLGRAGREHVRAYCSWPSVADATLSVYADALKG